MEVQATRDHLGRAIFPAVLPTMVRPESPRRAFCEAQALLKALKGFGLSQELLQQVQQSLVSVQKPVTLRLRQMATWKSS